MTLTEQLKVLNDKIKANKSQYDLDREAAKILALSSGELEKYEYLTGEDLGINQIQFKKQNLNLLLLVKSLIKDWMKVIKRKDF